MIDIDSSFVEPTQNPTSEDESCSGLAEIQVRAIDFSARSNIPTSVATDIRILDYTDQNESLEDNPDPLVDNPDPSFDRDNPYNHLMTTRLPINSIARQQLPFAPYT
jgi:hypothetical protein